jgi:hypothetical protein
MRFRVTPHMAAKPPVDALTLFRSRMPLRRDDVLFRTSGDRILASIDRDEPVAMTSDERVEIGRQVVLDAVGELCERNPGMRLSWYAVSPAG